MADIQKLVDATIRVKEKSDKSVGWPLAAIKAIERSGILNKADVARLKKQILTELRTRGVIKPRGRK